MKVLHDKGIFSIEGITVINPEVLPITAYVNSVLNLGSLVHNETQNVINDGDFFDLPENIIAEKIQHCDEYHFHGKSSCYVYRLKLKEPLVDKPENCGLNSCDYPKCGCYVAYMHDSKVEVKELDQSKPLVDTGSKITYDKIKEVEDVLGEPGIGALRIVENEFIPDDMVLVSSRIYKALKLNP